MRLRNIPRAKQVLGESFYVVQEPERLKGRWDEIFENKNPIHIEIGMGKGRFITTLAGLHPEINYIGIERYSSVLLRAVESLQKREEILPNLFLICIDAGRLCEYFAEDEVSRIYLNFSDPWPKARHAKRRLTSEKFLERYTHVLKKGAYVEFKTDNRDLFDFSMEEFSRASDWILEQHTFDLHHDRKMNAGNVMTEYELKFSGRGNPICKLAAQRIV